MLGPHVPQTPSTPRIWPVTQQFRGSTNQAIADATSADSPILRKDASRCLREARFRCRDSLR